MSKPIKRKEMKYLTKSDVDIFEKEFRQGNAIICSPKRIIDYIDTLIGKKIGEVASELTWYRNDDGLKELVDNVSYIKVQDLQDKINQK